MSGPRRVLVVFGTRPEVIKLAPVVWALGERESAFRVRAVATGQHCDLVAPLARELGVGIDIDLAAGAPKQSPLALHRRLIEALEPCVEAEAPDAILVQGDTATTFAAAWVGFHRRVPVGHVEAGLRSGDPRSPFPEEMNRRLVTRLADFHFAATAGNADTLRAEGVADERIAVTGNPVVDAVRWARAHTEPSAALRELLARVGTRRLLVLTTHRRESFGGVLGARLREVRRFALDHPDVAVVFPVHPNPSVQDPAERELAHAPGVLCVEPLPYLDFVHLLARAWVIVSDSGGVQEEAPSLGRPVLVIRENTERPEAVAAGVARLVGGAPGALVEALRACVEDPDWVQGVAERPNPFGEGDAGPRIADALERFLGGAR